MKALPRKIFHLSGVAIVALYLGIPLPKATAAAILGAIVLLLLLLDIARARSPALQERFLGLFRWILDAKDSSGLNGSTLYFAGCAATVALFAPAVAGAGILALAVGDPAAALVGSSVRSPRWGRVSLAGTCACFLFATLAVRTLLPWDRALMAGAAGAVLEAVSGSKLDNLAIPLGVAAVLALL